MSHNARYRTAIRNADKKILDMSLQWLQKAGVLKITKTIAVWQGRMNALGVGVTLSDSTYGIDIRISEDGTVDFVGENMAEGSFMRFKALLEETYKAVVARMEMAQMGFETEMQIVEENGVKGIDLVGVD